MKKLIVSLMFCLSVSSAYALTDVERAQYLKTSPRPDLVKEQYRIEAEIDKLRIESDEDQIKAKTLLDAAKIMDARGDDYAAMTLASESRAVMRNWKGKLDLINAYVEKFKVIDKAERKARDAYDAKK